MVKNLLKSLNDKVYYSIVMTSYAKSDCKSEESLWYHAIATFNSYYAIVEELNNVTQNSSDSILNKSVKNWIFLNKKDLDSQIKSARNKATHLGKVTTYTIWSEELDVMNDTSHPRFDYLISVEDSDIIEMHSNDFFDKCLRIFEILKKGISDINDDYQSEGGTTNAL